MEREEVFIFIMYEVSTSSFEETQSMSKNTTPIDEG
jgi:hypothetical protein